VAATVVVFSREAREMRIAMTTLAVFGLWVLGTFLVPSPRVAVVEEKETGGARQGGTDVESEAENVSSTVQL